MSRGPISPPWNQKQGLPARNRLPFCAIIATMDSPDPARNPERQPHPLSILLVDDDRNVVESLRLILRREGYRLLAAHSGEEAVKLARLENPDVIVMDERMPGLQGSQAFATLAAESPDTVRILLTGHASLEAAITAINQGRIFRLLEKPVSPETVRQALREGLELRNSRARGNQPRPRVPDGYARLSPREREVHALASRGLRTAQIAERLGRSPETVRNHLKAIYRKLGISSQSDLIDQGMPDGNSPS